MRIVKVIENYVIELVQKWLKEKPHVTGRLKRKSYICKGKTS